MKFSREFYFRAFYFRAHPFFHFRANLIFETKTSQMLVFSERKKKNQNMSFKNRAILFSRTFSCANHSNSRGLYIRAGALRENKTHTKIS